MEFTIDRSKWRCGGNSADSLGEGAIVLLNRKGFMCCLGQIALQLGCENEEIKGFGYPSDVDRLRKENNILVSIKKDIERLSDSRLSLNAIEINDNMDITQKERERRLKELFKKNGHSIKFINKGVKSNP